MVRIGKILVKSVKKKETSKKSSDTEYEEEDEYRSKTSKQALKIKKVKNRITLVNYQKKLSVKKILYMLRKIKIKNLIS